MFTIIMNKSLLLLIVVVAPLLLAITTTAFVIPSSSSSCTTTIYSTSAPLEEVNPAFDGYSLTDPTQQLVTKDVVTGNGELAEDGKVLTMAYQGKLLSNGIIFDSGTGYSFRLGEGKVIPGWEQGVKGMRVGGTRLLRIPPNLAYADRGAKDVIPPGSHLEFSCELKSVASNPLEELTSQINMQPERLITFGLLLILLVASSSFTG